MRKPHIYIWRLSLRFTQEGSSFYLMAWDTVTWVMVTNIFSTRTLLAPLHCFSSTFLSISLLLPRKAIFILALSLTPPGPWELSSVCLTSYCFISVTHVPVCVTARISLLHLCISPHNISPGNIFLTKRESRFCTGFTSPPYLFFTFPRIKREWLYFKDRCGTLS